ncbi:DUF1905 domain-containing protein [Deinococcus hohokamensis]|uniref:DUF1905 domain-containing protein n=1 Tax=Deinococcus hohokamensis TaxID=309883 RepID=A0ABV9I880_9DEIO
MTLEFSGNLWFWRGPAPHHFVTVPEQESAELKALSRLVTYGWGMIPVRVTLGETVWPTSLFEKDGRYIVPVRASVRQAEGVGEGDTVSLQLELR